MADTTGMADIRGIDINKLATGFADEENIFKQFLTVSNTSAREIRWYQKTAGFLTGTTTTGITASPGANVSQLALPDVIEQSVTRQTSYVRKYFWESPWISLEDIRDCDPDMLAINVRDVTRAVENQVDKRIYDALSGGVSLRMTSSGSGWDDLSTGNPFLDLLSGAMAIRTYSYDVSNITVLMSPNAYKWLMNYFVSVKGSSVPSLSANLAQNGVLATVAGQRIVVSQNCTDTWAVQIVPQTVASWKTFMPITAAQKTEEGIGVKIRVWEEGEILVTNPYAGCVINVQI